MSTTATDTTQFRECDMDDIQGLLTRIQDIDLPEKDKDLLRDLIHSHAYLIHKLGSKNMSIKRLRQLIFGATTETKKNVDKQANKARGTETQDKPDQKKPKDPPPGHGRLSADAYTGAEVNKIPHQSLKPGDPCPVKNCLGRVYEKSPIILLRIKGQAPFVATRNEQARLRCNLCNKIFKADLPEGMGDQKYGESVIAWLAFLRYCNGLPMKRIEEMQRQAGVPFPDSTQWALLEKGDQLIRPIFRELIRLAGQGSLLYNDDTPMKLLDFMKELKEREANGEPPPERTGTRTTGIVSELADRWRIVLYFTGWKHAGENLIEVLKNRDAGLDPPLQMCDGLSHNVPGELETILCNCLAHARRQFADCVFGFPDEVQHVIDELALVYKHEAETKGERMTPTQRLKHHKKYSTPVMKRLKDWMDKQIAEKLVEPNSELGKAINYALKRWDRLTRFLSRTGAPLDNNLTERMLKRAIIHRKNSIFYKTEKGAAVGDLYMSLISTAKLTGINPCRYLEALLQHQGEIAGDPGSWLPWNYQETLKNLPTN